MPQSETSGLFQWLKWGTAATPAGIFGLLTGGDLTVDPDTRTRIGVGGNKYSKGGLVKFGCSASFNVSGDNAALINHGFRASYPRGVLQTLHIAGGADLWGREYADSYITEGTITWAVGEALKCDLTFGALGVSEVLGSTMPDMIAEAFEDWEFVVTVEGAEYQAQSVGLKWANAVNFGGGGNTAAAGVKRWPKYALVGMETSTVEVALAKPIPSSVDAAHYDCLDEDITVVLTGENCNGDTLVITGDALMFSGPQSHALVMPETLADWKYGFAGVGQAGNISVVYTAT
jgi:hypothetical protein